MFEIVKQIFRYRSLLVQKHIDAIGSEKMSVFCGAGISFNSGVPIVNQIINETLQELKIEDNDITLFHQRHFPFEIFIEILFEKINSTAFLKIFNQGMANTNHKLIAKLAKTGQIVCIYTTNFDLLIEQALVNENVDFIKYYLEDDFDKIDFNNNKVILVKLHGCISDETSIRTTMRSIVARAPSSKRLIALKGLFNNTKYNNIVFLGYSCSDIYDLSPQIASIENKSKSVYFIEHDTQEKVEDIRIKKVKNPFKNKQGLRIYVDTNVFIERIWKLKLNQFEFIKSITNWQDTLKNAFKNIEGNLPLLYSLSGKLFSEIITDNSLAIKYYCKCIQPTFSSKIEYWSSHIHIAGAQLALSNKKAALLHIREVLKYTRRNNSNENIDETKFDLCDLLCRYYFAYGLYKSSIKYGNASMQYTKTLQKEKRYHLLQYLCNVYIFDWEFEKSIDVLNKILEEIRNDGFWYIEPRIYLALGTVYFKIGNIERSVKYVEEAYTEAQKNGNLFFLSVCSINLSNIELGVNKNYKKAEKLLNEALAINILIESKREESLCLNNLAHLYSKLGKNRKTKYFLEQSINLAQEINFYDEVLRGKMQLQALYINAYHNYKKAIQLGHELLNELRPELREDIVSRKRDIVYNIAVCHFNLREYKPAKEFIEAAIEIDTENPILSTRTPNLDSDNALLNRINTNL
jgi:tetratricopeptide (TPR) repeat protein